MQKNKKPLISVILPVYNASDFLTTAIESILAQSFHDFELVIVDDASTDESWEIISRYQKRYPNKIKAVHLKKNLNKGGDEAGNVAFRIAKGKFIARMDADDLAHPLRLEKQVKFLKENPQVGILGSSAIVINAQGEKIGLKKVLTDHQQIYSNYFTFHPMIHPTLMIRRSILSNSNQLYQILHPTNNDYLTFFSYINQGVKFANLDEPLIQYRLHNNNDSLRDVKKTFKNTMRIRWFILRKYNYQPSLISWLKCGLQLILVALLPEIIIFNLYLLIRGIYKPKFIFDKPWQYQSSPA